MRKQKKTWKDWVCYVIMGLCAIPAAYVPVSYILFLLDCIFF